MSTRRRSSAPPSATEHRGRAATQAPDGRHPHRTARPVEAQGTHGGARRFGGRREQYHRFTCPFARCLAADRPPNTKSLRFVHAIGKDRLVPFLRDTCRLENYKAYDLDSLRVCPDHFGPEAFKVDHKGRTVLGKGASSHVIPITEVLATREANRRPASPPRTTKAVAAAVINSPVFRSDDGPGSSRKRRRTQSDREPESEDVRAGLQRAQATAEDIRAERDLLRKEVEDLKSKLEGCEADLAYHKGKLAAGASGMVGIRLDHFDTTPVACKMLTAFEPEAIRRIAEFLNAGALGLGMTRRETAASKGPGGRGDTGRAPVLDHLNRVFLVLLILRTGLTFEVAAAWFDIKRNNVSDYFRATLILMDKAFAVVYPMPSRDSVRENFPAKIKDMLLCDTVYMTIDCTGVPIQVPSNPTAQSATHSTYYGGNVIKFIIGVTPDGMMSYISDALNGGLSDYGCVVESRFPSILTERRMDILADKGFTSCGLLLIDKGAFLYTPERLGKDRQFGWVELTLSRMLAKIRIHVERAVRKVKEWKFFSARPIPSGFQDLVDPSLRVVRVLCNMLGRSTFSADEDDEADDADE